MVETIPHAIPTNTPPPRLRQLLVRYLDPSIPVPLRYRRAMLARITSLLVSAPHGLDGAR